MSTISKVRMCDTCLASGRSVALLGSLRHVFAALTDCAADTERLLACWECVALLRRAARFRLRAARVQFCLQTDGPLDSHDFESGSSLCAVGPVAEIHINPETEDEQLADIKCEYDPDAHYDYDSAQSIQDTLEEQTLNNDIKMENKESIDFKSEFEITTSTICVDTITKKNLNENKKKFYTIKFSKKQMRDHLDEKRKLSAFVHAEYKCVKCAIILHKNNYKKHQSLHENTHKHVCRVCKIRLKTKRMLERHSEKHYLRYQCSSCPFTTRSVCVMRYHKCKQHLESDTTSREEAERKDETYSSSASTYKCDRSEETFLHPRSMIAHSLSHDITESRGAECDFSAETDELETHTQQAHGQTQEQDTEYTELTDEPQSTTDPTLICETCNQPFFSEKSLQGHIYRCHKDSKARGRGRPSTRNSVRILSEEEMWKTREQEASSVTFKYAKWKCEKCVMIFFTKSNFSRHERLHLMKYNFICKICTMPIKSAKALKEHTQAHYTLYKCTECDHSSVRRIRSNHYEIHSKPNKGFQCTICEMWFEQWAERNAHVKEHKDVNIKNVANVYECEKCSKRLSCKKRMERHLLAHDRKYECSVCPHRATSSGNLSSHYKRHHLMAPVLNEVYCVKCKKQFLTEDGYKVHVATVHNKVKTKVPCTICNKVFSTKAALKSHINFYHLKQRNFVCKFCNKNLSKKDSLQMHIKYVHEGFRVPKTHMCTFCNQGFSTRRTLIHHVRTHTGERPHKCEYCNASFAQFYAMKIHVRNIHLKLAVDQKT